MEPTIGVLYVHAAGVAGPLFDRLKTADERLAIYRRQAPRRDGGPGVDCILLDAPDGMHVQKGVETARAAYEDVPIVVRTDAGVDVPSNTAEAIVGVADGASVDELVATLIETAAEALVPEQVVLRDEVLESVPMGVSIADASRPDLPLVYVNDHFEALTGYPKHEILGLNCRFLQGEETREEPVEEMGAAIDAGDSVIVELRNYRRDGSEFWNRVELIPVTTIDGAVTHYLGFQRDVSADHWRAAGEARVRDHRSRLLELVQGTDQGVSIEKILSLGRQALGTPGAALTVRDTETGQWTLLAESGEYDLQGEPMEVGEQYHARVLEERDCWVVPDSRTEGTEPNEDGPEVGCYIGAPVCVDGEVVGTVSFVGGCTRAADFSETERTFTTLVATLIGRELEREEE